MTEARQKNITLRYAIKFKAGGLYPVGAIPDPFVGEIPAGFLVCDGSLVSIAAYPELFAVVGYQFGNALTIKKYVPPTWWRRVTRSRKGMLVDAPNPDHKPGYFALPDLRGHFHGGVQ